MPSAPPPMPPIDYGNPNTPRPPSSHPVGRFFIGLIAGTLLSAIVWLSLFNRLGQDSTGQLLFASIAVVIGAKVVTSIFLFVTPGRRAIGAGLLTSILTGFMTFFGVCAANFKM